MSQKRRAALPARAAVLRAVIERQAGRCAGVDALPGHRCGYFPPDRPGLEVHELVSRGAGGDWLDPDNCVALCPVAHDLVTGNPALGYRSGLRRRWSPPDT